MAATVKPKYSLKACIGKGSYGQVTKAECRATGQTVALKVMQCSKLTEYELIKLLREVMILRRLTEISRHLQPSEDRVKFFPELIEILCPKKADGNYDLMDFCFVIDYTETDLDTMLKH